LISSEGENNTRNETFTDAEHQLIGMKLSYISENHAARINGNTSQEELDEILNDIIRGYRKELEDENVYLVEGVPQYFNTTAEVESSRYLMEGMPGRGKEVETGNHINAITRGDPSDPDEIVVVIPGTTFDDVLDWEQTVHHTLNNRSFDYSEEAIEYVGDLIEKYPDAKITVDGHSMAGKIAMQIGMTYPNVQVNAYNPTALDKEFRKMLDDDVHYDNINVFVYDDEIAGLERLFRYITMEGSGRSMEGMPFQVYHMEDDRPALKDSLPDGISEYSRMYRDMIRSRNLKGWIEQHSNGAYRGLDGSLIDIFKLSPFTYTNGAIGGTEIEFNKQRYLDLANLLESEIVPQLKKALGLHESMEEDISGEIRGIIDKAESGIMEIEYDKDVIGMTACGDPRVDKISEFKGNYLIDGKYRCYDNSHLTELLEKNHNLQQRLSQFASRLQETAHHLEIMDMMSALNIKGSKKPMIL
jgi:pimeloyl-ACP methyl ester carboxylesterase